MKQLNYKKTYEGDYTKSYRDQVIWAKESAKRKQDYDTISKKLKSNTYNKKERSAVYDIIGTLPKESERVYAEGAHHEKRNPASPIGSTRKERKVENTTTKQDQQKSINENKKASPKPKTTTKQEKKTQITREEDDGDYSYLNPPLKQIGLNKYLNLKTQKEIGVDEARRILQRSGYQTKKNKNIGGLVFIYIIINIILPFYISAIIAILYGLSHMFKVNTTWIKTYKQQLYHFILPSSPQDLENNKRLAWISISVGVLTLIFRGSYLFFRNSI